MAAWLLSVTLTGNEALAAWQDKTAGQPLIQILSAKDLGSDTKRWIVLQDKLGRLFVGDYQLRVFDGQSWQSFPIPNVYALRSLALGEDGRLWAGAVDEVGYFDEPSLGSFRYHSLVQFLPEEERAMGDVWTCAAVGRSVFFVCREKVLRWDGTAFRVWHYPGQARLFPVQLDGEIWFQHWATGLYRVTENGPQLEVPAALLPPASGIMGLTKDADGLLLVTSRGLYQPGTPPHRVSDDALTKFLTEAKPASFALLPDGNLAIGTLNGGMVVADPSGRLLRILNTADGLPDRTILWITPPAEGNAWAGTISGIFQFEAGGHATLFGPASGLKGSVVDIAMDGDRFHVLTQAGAFGLVSATQQRGGHFAPLAPVIATYNHLLPYHGGLLLSGHGGVDFFDGVNVRTVFAVKAQSVFFTRAFRTKPDSFYSAELNGLGRLDAQPDGSFVHARMLELPEACASLYEEPTGRLWIGTLSHGAFTYDPVHARLAPVNDPASGKPFSGSVSVLGNDEQILLSHDQRVLQVQPAGTGLRLLADLPASVSNENVIRCIGIPGRRDVLIPFKHPRIAGNSPLSLGRLTIAQTGKARWQELDVPALASFGSINTMVFSREDNRLILWVGGSDGLLRLDYDTIPEVKNPDAPLIRLDGGHSSAARETGELAFPFEGHRLSFRVFTGNYAKSKDWLLQSRLGDGRGEWTAPSSLRAFEFSNLSEGDYRFEVRAVNPAGLTGEPAAFAFRILPPWYRSGWAFAGYAGLFAGSVFLLVRIRERRIRRRNQDLEKTVALRTAELVKASAAKDEFLASISHEIRNPMNGVIGIAETFRTETLDTDSRYKFSLLRSCASHLSSLLEDILDFSRVQAGMIELETRPFELAELLESITAITASESEQRGIPVEIAVSPAVPAQLVGDPRRIRQILLNLVGNALKFAGRGQVDVTIWRKAAGPGQAEIIFAVSDEGPGISPEEQQRLFTRFERGAAAQQDRVPGTGLGLALSKGLAEKMGGRIWVESEPGQGSCFYFSAAFATPETAASVPAAPAQTNPGSGRTALVVDDEEYNRIVLSEHLHSLGFAVQSAADGPAALALALARNFDCVFLDYALPGMNGLAISRALRALPNATARALIVATTAFTTADKRAQCLAAGMDTFLGKPITKERLRQVLARVDPTNIPAPAFTPVPDPLANLRLITQRKGTSFADEVALYLSELMVEWEHLRAALQQGDTAATSRYAHLLYGRCAFIAERELEQTLRRIEAAAATGRWDEARELGRAVESQFAGLRLRLASAGSTSPAA